MIYTPHRMLRIKWARCVTRVGEGEVQVGFWWETGWKREFLEDPRVDGSIILKWMEHGLE